MNQKLFVIDKDLLTDSKKMEIQAEGLIKLVDRFVSIARHDSLTEYLATKGAEIRD